MNVNARLLSFLSYGLFIYLAAYLMLDISDSILSRWSQTEALINYQGGFVRRGLIGELIFQSSDAIGLANSLQKYVVVCFLFSLFVILVFEKDIVCKFLLLALVTFASGGLLDFVFNSAFLYLERKEIWFYSALGLMFLSTRIFDFYDLKNILIISILSVLMTLHHELYAVFTVPLLLLIVMLSGPGNALKSIVLTAPTFIALLLVVIHHGDEAVANLIKESYKLKFTYNIGWDAIDAIGWNFETSQNFSRKMIAEGSLRYWFYHIFVNVAFLIIFVVYKGKTFRDLFIYITIIFIALGATVFAMIAGWDWGRWISMFVFMSVFFIYIISAALSNVAHPKFLNIHNNKISDRSRMQIVTLLLLCSLVGLNMNVQLPICCPKPANLGFVQPIKFIELIPLR